MTKKKLFDDDSEEEEVALKTENEYAKKYDRWREKEELHKLEQKYGSKPSGSDVSGSDSEEESDEPPEIPEEVETQFLKTLALLKTKDPRIYDPSYKFFDEKAEKEKEKKEEVKTVTFADSDDDDDDDPNIFSIEKKAVIDEPVAKKKPEQEKLKDYLTGKVEHIDENVEKDLAPLKSLWSDPKLSEGEAFLRDYILNKRYLDPDEAPVENKVRDDEDLEADEKTVEEQGKFERAYNFRFEEPDEEYLKRYPRTMNYIRPKDDRRSRKRAEIRERKEQEKKKKMEEIARLKALKLKEIQEKIAKIKEVTGNEDLAFEEADIEGDFDPEEHDRRMKAIFDEQFYGQEDDEKPVFPDLDEELEIENWDKYEENYDQDNTNMDDDGPHCEDEDFNMDADYDPKAAKQNLLEELQRNQNKKRRNRKKKSKLAEILSQEKPKFAPQEEKSYAEYMEEYYKMDCEDVIGDLPTRFKYREVVPNDYGLTIEEILLADDKELTQWVPIKKIVKYRPENIEKSEVNTYKQKAADERLKKKILPSLYKDLPEEPEIVVPIEETILNKKKKKKKKKNKNKPDQEGTSNSNETEQHLESDVVTPQNESIEKDNASDEKRKKKNKKKHQDNKSTNDISINGDDQITESSTENESKKSKKKHKNKDEHKQLNSVKSNNTEDIDSAITSVNKNISLESNTKVSKKKKKHLDTNSLTDNNDDKKLDPQLQKEDNKTNIPSKKSKKDKKKNQNSFTVEDLTEKDNKASAHASTNIRPKKRKAGNDDSNISKKKKKQNMKWKSKPQDKTDKANPLTKLSDERLKAYGLNPKKYRSFLKYKKF